MGLCTSLCFFSWGLGNLELNSSDVLKPSSGFRRCDGRETAVVKALRNVPLFPLDSLYLPYKMHMGTRNLVITAGKKKKTLCSSWSDFSSWEKLGWGPSTRNRQASSYCLGNWKKHKAERDQTVPSKIDSEPAGKKYKLFWTFPLNLNRTRTLFGLQKSPVSATSRLALSLQHWGHHRCSRCENCRLGPQLTTSMYCQWRANPIAPNRNSFCYFHTYTGQLLLSWKCCTVRCQMDGFLPVCNWAAPGILYTDFSRLLSVAGEEWPSLFFH